MIGIYIGFVAYGVYCHFTQKAITIVDYKQMEYKHNIEMPILKDKLEKLEKRRWF